MKHAAGAPRIRLMTTDRLLAWLAAGPPEDMRAPLLAEKARRGV